MLSPWKVICKPASMMLILLLEPLDAGAASPFPVPTIPESCFTRGSVEENQPEKNETIFQSDLTMTMPVPEEGLPPEGEHYTRVITNTKRAWNITEGSSSAVVAIVDSGIDTEHPDLVENLWVNSREKYGTPGVDDDRNGFVDDVHGWDFVLNQPLTKDGTGHGTHCAGNVAATRNGRGVVGVAPGVRVMGVRFINSKGKGDTKNAIKAIVYAALNGAKVISNSWGSGNRNKCVELAIQFARSRGAIVVASANNNKRNIDRRASYPAAYPGVIAVASSDRNDQRSSGSNWGKNRVSLFAPGEASLSTDKNDRYSEKTGTSMAAPQVAGAIALGISLKPRLSRDRLLEILCSSSSQVLKDLSRCGRLDVGAFLEATSRE